MNIEQACNIVAEKIMGWTKAVKINTNTLRWLTKDKGTVSADCLRTGNGMVELMDELRKQGIEIHISVCRTERELLKPFDVRLFWRFHRETAQQRTMDFAETAQDALIFAAAELAEQKDG